MSSPKLSATELSTFPSTSAGRDNSAMDRQSAEFEPTTGNAEGADGPEPINNDTAAAERASRESASTASSNKNAAASVRSVPPDAIRSSETRHQDVRYDSPTSEQRIEPAGSQYYFGPQSSAAPPPDPATSRDSQQPRVVIDSGQPNRASSNASRPRRRRRTSGSVEEEWAAETTEEEAEELKYGADHVIKLFIPITICMGAVVLIVSTVEYYRKTNVYLPYTPFHDETDDWFTLSWQAVLNSLIILVMIAIMTTVLVVLFKCGCYKVINAWLVMSTVLLCFIFSFIFLGEVLQALNAPIDYFTVAVIMWNFGVTGIISIHGRGPMLMQQAYLISIAALTALIFIKYLPGWTTWVVLVVLSFWDLFAVLTKHGPLRILVETAHERNVNLFPALIYSSGMAFLPIGMARHQASEQNPAAAAPLPNTAQQRALSHHSRSEPAMADGSRASDLETADADDELQDDSIRLGLGDFIFYSVLVGRASTSYDWNVTLACYFAILIGLCLTLVLLALHKKALPALPISLFLGVTFYVVTSNLLTPFLGELAARQIFI